MRAYGCVSELQSMSNIDRHTRLYQTIPTWIAVGIGHEAETQIWSSCECETSVLVN